MLKRLASTFQSGLNTAVAVTRDGVNRALPGNPALRDYDVQDPQGCGGAHGLWDIYDAIKKTSKTRCSVWIFDKNKHLQGLDKTKKEEIISSLKHGVLSLCRLQHPRILSVERRLEESTYSLVFVTERVQGSLADLLKNKEVETDSNSGLFDVEMRYGLLQIIEAIGFIHESAKIFHCNLTTNAVAVTEMGGWKLSGLEFSKSFEDDNFKFEENSPTISLVEPSILAPELFETKILTKSSDCFSLGVLLYECYTGQRIIDCSPYDAKRTVSNNKGKYNSSSLLHRLPVEVRDHCKMLMSLSVDLRPTPDQLRGISFFQSAGALTLQYLDTLLQRPVDEKIQFFADLPNVLAELPSRVRTGLVLSSMQPEFANSKVLPTILPSVFKIIELSSGDEFVDKILPVIADLFSTNSPKGASIMIENLPLMLQKMTEAKKPEHIRNYLLPLLGKALAQEKQSHLQAKSLEVIPKMAEHLDEATIKSSLVPKIKAAALSESCTSAVKVSILVSLGMLVPRLDRWFIMDSVLDWVPKMIERTPGVLVASLGVYQTVLTNEKLGLTKEFIANNALPTLLPLSMDSQLTLDQFQRFMRVIRLMLDRIEQEQSNKLKSMTSGKKDGDVSLSAIRGAQSSGDSSNALFGLETASTTASAPMVASSAGGMSMEQKIAEAKRREMEKNFKAQPQIVPNASSTAKNTTSAKPKDLASTLMNKNMMNMTRPQMTISNNFGMASQPDQSGIGLFNQKALPPTSAMGSMSMSPAMSNHPMMSPMMSTSSSMGMMANSNPNSLALSNSSSFGSLAAPQQNGNQPSWFNPMTAQGMAPMSSQPAQNTTNGGFLMPTVNHSATSQSSQAKKLSPSDIANLLG